MDPEDYLDYYDYVDELEAEYRGMKQKWDTGGDEITTTRLSVPITKDMIFGFIFGSLLMIVFAHYIC